MEGFNSTKGGFNGTIFPKGSGGGGNGHSPYIGDNGNWFEWDDTTQQFVDTGTKAQGATGPQGPQGNTGSSVDYPFELVNNLTTDDATKALSAAQGKVLDGKITVLDEKVGTVSSVITWQDLPLDKYINSTGGLSSGAGSYICSDKIFLRKGQRIDVKCSTVTSSVTPFAIYDESDAVVQLFPVSPYQVETKYYVADADGIYARVCCSLSQKDILNVAVSATGLTKDIENNAEEISSINEKLTILPILRKQIFIERTDSDIVIYSKFKQAFSQKNTDVVFERGDYVLEEVYNVMYQEIGSSYRIGLPIGNGNRYYLNGSTITGRLPQDYGGESFRILDTQQISTNFEIYDGTLIIGDTSNINHTDSTTIYCVHDESDSSLPASVHKYHNITFKSIPSDSICAIGCGTGKDQMFIIDDCVFYHEGFAQNFQLHGPTHAEVTEPKLTIKVTGTYASDGNIVKVSGELYSNGRIDIEVSNSCYKSPLIIQGGTDITINKIEYNNSVIES